MEITLKIQDSAIRLLLLTAIQAHRSGALDDIKKLRSDLTKLDNYCKAQMGWLEGAYTALDKSFCKMLGGEGQLIPNVNKMQADLERLRDDVNFLIERWDKRGL